MDKISTSQNEQYEQASAQFGDAIGRLAYVYEKDADKRKDLVQDIHFELWRSLKIFDGRASLRTWVYRIAHNTAASHVLKNKRFRQTQFIDIDDIADVPDDTDYVRVFEDIDQLETLMSLIQKLSPTDRQIISLYLEDIEAVEIGEIAGLSSAAVATRIHRIKHKLAKIYKKGDHYDK